MMMMSMMLNDGENTEEGATVIMLLVVGMQNDKLRAMAYGGEEESLRRVLTVPTPSGVDAFRSEVNRSIEFAAASRWRITYVMDLHHPMHFSFESNGGALHPHCVLSTLGCNPVSGMHFGWPESDLLIRGVDTDGDSADAFWITAKPHRHACPTRLLESLGGSAKKPKQEKKGSKRSSHKEPPVLVLCGASPDGCIENTAASAMGFGMRVCAVENGLWMRDGAVLPPGVRALRLEDILRLVRDKSNTYF